MQKIGKTKPTLFEDFLLLSLHKDWLDVFGEIPEFDVQIDSKRRLHIISTKSIPYTKST